MTSHPNSSKDKGFEKLAARLQLIHSQPDAEAANATVTGFHGANTAQLRRLYIAEHARAFLDRARLVNGQELVDVFTEAWSAAHPTVRPWTGADLKCAREALGLSMVQLADWLPWKQSRVSEAERDIRRVPTWVAGRMRELECARDSLAGAMVAHLEATPDAPLVVHATDTAYREAHPTDPAIPAAVQRVAAGLAAAEIEDETGERPVIVYATVRKEQAMTVYRVLDAFDEAGHTAGCDFPTLAEAREQATKAIAAAPGVIAEMRADGQAMDEADYWAAIYRLPLVGGEPSDDKEDWEQIELRKLADS